MKEDYATSLGNDKYISEPDENGFIYKVFKTKEQILPINQQREILERKKKYFGNYIPETELVETENGEYVIKQKFIEGKTLAQTDIPTLSSETLEQLIDLIKKYLKYYKEQGGDMDITGYQYYPGNLSNIKKKIINFLKINQNFLTSTNIMIGNDGNVYMVDVCESTISRLQGKIKNFIAKPFIKRTIHNLETTLQRKLDFKNKNISKELVYTLEE